MIKEIHLAGGCFWGVEAYMSRVNGVVDAISGYANGITKNPKYEELSSTGHSETVKVIYDDEVIDLEKILRHYLRIIDPTSLNRQGGDVGLQYRTGIYYTDESERKIAEEIIDRERAKYEEPIVVEILPLSGFYEAEEYHQNYLEKHPDGYCHIDLSKVSLPLED